MEQCVETVWKLLPRLNWSVWQMDIERRKNIVVLLGGHHHPELSGRGVVWSIV